MGGAGYIFTGEHDAEVMHNSAIHKPQHAPRRSESWEFTSTSTHLLHAFIRSTTKEAPRIRSVPKNQLIQLHRTVNMVGRNCSAKDYISPSRATTEFKSRVLAFITFLDREGTWRGGREKAPAAICRKVAEVEDDGEIEMWGDGTQTRSFLYIDECVEGVRRFMESEFTGPVNIGSDEMVTLNQLAQLAMAVAGKQVRIRHVPGPLVFEAETRTTG